MNKSIILRSCILNAQCKALTFCGLYILYDGELMGSDVQCAPIHSKIQIMAITSIYIDVQFISSTMIFYGLNETSSGCNFSSIYKKKYRLSTIFLSKFLHTVPGQALKSFFYESN